MSNNDKYDTVHETWQPQLLNPELWHWQTKQSVFQHWAPRIIFIEAKKIKPSPCSILKFYRKTKISKWNMIKKKTQIGFSFSKRLRKEPCMHHHHQYMLCILRGRALSVRGVSFVIMLYLFDLLQHSTYREIQWPHSL